MFKRRKGQGEDVEDLEVDVEAVDEDTEADDNDSPVEYDRRKATSSRCCKGGSRAYQGKMTSARAEVPVAMNAAATKAEATVVVMKRRMMYSRGGAALVVRGRSALDMRTVRSAL